MRKVLVVDDEPALARGLSRLLKRQYSVFTANSGQQALDILEVERAIDAVLCDISMPGMTGQALYEEAVRRYPALEHRFRFMSGGSPVREDVEWRDRMRHRILAKPFPTEHLFAAIEAACEAKNEDSPTVSSTQTTHRPDDER